MKKIKLLFTILIILLVAKNGFSWDSEAAKFYPLTIGNTWSYHKIVYANTGSICIQILSESDFIVTIPSDTIMPNGKRYFKILGPDIYSTFYERIDSVKMNVYRYSGGGECLIDSLFAKINNNFKSCRQLLTSTCNVSDTNAITFAGQSRRVKHIYGNASISHRYKLMYGLGIYEERVCNFGGATSTLNGAIINGVLYGVLINGIKQISTEIPKQFSLSQNYPNPFNPTTKIKFDIPLSPLYERGVGGFVCLKVYDILGHEVSTLVNEQLKPGTYEVEWDGDNFASGIYYYTLQSESFKETKRMLIIK
jgi:hypothetical protein